VIKLALFQSNTELLNNTINILGIDNLIKKSFDESHLDIIKYLCAGITSIDNFEKILIAVCETGNIEYTRFIFREVNYIAPIGSTCYHAVYLNSAKTYQFGILKLLHLFITDRDILYSALKYAIDLDGMFEYLYNYDIVFDHLEEFIKLCIDLNKVYIFGFILKECGHTLSEDKQFNMLLKLIRLGDVSLLKIFIDKLHIGRNTVYLGHNINKLRELFKISGNPEIRNMI